MDPHCLFVLSVSNLQEMKRENVEKQPAGACGVWWHEVPFSSKISLLFDLPSFSSLFSYPSIPYNLEGLSIGILWRYCRHFI